MSETPRSEGLILATLEHQQAQVDASCAALKRKHARRAGLGLLQCGLSTAAAAKKTGIPADDLSWLARLPDEASRALACDNGLESGDGSTRTTLSFAVIAKRQEAANALTSKQKVAMDILAAGGSLSEATQRSGVSRADIAMINPKAAGLYEGPR